MSRRSKGRDGEEPAQGARPAETAAADAMLGQAQALYRTGRLRETAAFCEEILARHPRHFDALHLRAIVEFGLGRPEEAVRLVARALDCNPRSEHAHNTRGLMLQALGRHAEALASYDGALAFRPDFPDALYNRGNALHDLKRSGEALASYDGALALRPDYVEAHYNRGLVLQELAQYREALASYDRAVALRPELVDAHYNRGLVLHELRRHDEALASYERALALRPDFPEALNNRGNTLRCLNRFDEALDSFGRALRLAPDYIEALIGCGLTLQDLGRCSEALDSFDQALARRPDSAEAHCGASQCRLLLGDYVAGWTEYEWRWKNPRAERMRPFDRPLWQGTESIAGRTVLLWAEQGFGDTLQFCRYARCVAEAGARVVLEVQPPLKTLLSRLQGTAQVLARGEPLPAFDYHCPLMSLPRAFGTTLGDIPAGGAYVEADDARIREWEYLFADAKRPRIGLAWSGDPRHPNDRNRSMRLTDLRPLLDVGAAFVSLQKEVREEDAERLAAWPEISHAGARIRDFADTAAIISHLDLVLTVDTSVAHLAAAMGKPAWILLCGNPDWRWMLQREDSPWYPAARLFRQRAGEDWRDVIERVRQELMNRRGVVI